MKPFLKIVSIFLFAICIVSCGDGRHVSTPLLGIVGVPDGEDPGADLDITEKKIECVDVRNYNKIEYTKTTIGGDSLKLSAIDSIAIINEKSSNKSLKFATASKKYTDEERRCISNEISDMNSSGDEHYWQSVTWIVTRQAMNKPAKSDVTVIDFISCEQISNAECLLYN